VLKGAAKRRQVRRRAAAALIVVAVAGGGGTAWAMVGTSGASYRTAAASRESIQQSVELTGTLSAVKGVDLDFEVSGTVAKVLVKQGGKVTAGQSVAVLDRSALRETLTAARRTLAQARESLTSAEAGETSSAASTSGGGTSTATTAYVIEAASSPSPAASGSSAPTTGTGGTTTGGSGSDTATLTADQKAVVAAQHKADAALAAAKAALSVEASACAAETTPTTTTSDATACTTAAKTLLADEQTVSKDLTAVRTADTALDEELTAAIKNAGSSGSTPTSGSSSSPAATSSGSTGKSSAGSTVTGTTGSGATSTNTSGSSSTTVTAATLDADQATIDTDRSAVLSAEADLSQATLTSPISGQVLAVTVTKGDSVSGSSSASSPAVEIVGSGQDNVTVDVSASQVRQLAVGMKASVTPDGSSSALGGSVVAISLAGTESSTTGTVSYPVTVNVDRGTTSLVSGADATVSLAVGTADDVVAVPTSAVHYSGNRAYVNVARSGTLVRRTITVGARGADFTQVRSGLTDGQRVVLANLDAAVPSSSTTTTTGTGLGGTRGSGGAGPASGGAPPGAP
jgi:HlyD family secretion protein